MAEKDQQPGYPLAPVNGYSRSDEEAATAQSDDLRRQKRKKCCLYIIAFAIFQTGIIVLISMTIMKVKTPKFRVGSATFDSFAVQPSTPSFSLGLNAQLAVKNTNFGPYKFDETIIYFYYKDVQVGSAVVPNSKAGFRSTKNLNVQAVLTSTNLANINSELSSDLNSGTLSLTGKSTLSGKVELMFIMKKKKSVDLSCTLDVNISSRDVQNINCN
ncbi:hypothetical protein U1Q18_004672 [Sarracenia purpurea var. burkii]